MQIDPNALYSLVAEQAVLGRLLAAPGDTARIAGALDAGDFHVPEHRTLFSAIKTRRGEGAPSDPLSVADALRSEVNPEYVSGLLAQASASDAVDGHVRLLRDYTARRDVAALGQALIRSAADPQVPGADELLGRVRAQSESVVRAGTRGGGHARSYRDLLPPYLQDLRERTERGDSITGLSTGIDDFDRLTLGLQRQDLVILAGRPSMGKTALAINIVEHACALGNRALIFSMEMPASSLLQRSYASVGEINVQRLRSGKLSQLEEARLAEATEKLANFNIRIDDRPGLTLDALSASAHREHNIEPVDLVVVDYLQLMSGSRTANNTNDRVSEISRGLKNLGRELNAPVLALSQLNRSLEQRPDKRPVASDLRDSGSIEQDADLIMFVYRDEVYHPDTRDKNIAELIVAKQRNGPIGTVRTRFAGEYSRFGNLAL
ncbi:replicative DNA helicase [Natronocella acetinitrilica]|uniref:Replicative DNA helicase n=1 Tax=Natronocella acetinitrilica TaxID=414046 RepID=A0AAE3G4F9_9GAMM|nr:replicative DNA helicase [Natronocella acetinitrilica]MCP1674203.1 replicative DNA helicase [Natronocella acetinitrilica]